MKVRIREFHVRERAVHVTYVLDFYQKEGEGCTYLLHLNAFNLYPKI